MEYISSLAVAEVSENKLDGSHLIIKCTFVEPHRRLDSQALVDCGASRFSFFDREFARQHNLPQYTLREPHRLEIIDGRPIDKGDITHMVKINLDITGHQENLSAFVAKLGHYPLVLGIPGLRYHNQTIDWERNTYDFVSPRCTTTCAPRPTKATTMNIPPPRPRTIDIAAVLLTGFRKIVRKEKSQHEVASTFAISATDIDTMLEQPNQDRTQEIHEEYREFATLFSEVEANRLPPHRPGDHRIQLRKGTAPSFGPLYSLSKQQLEVLRKWLDEKLAKGFIRPSLSPAGSPILFVKKNDGSLRLCIDYHDLNKKTIKNLYPFPLIQETLMQLSKAKYFTKLDISGAYNLMRMAEGEEWKTTFRTGYGLFESLVMPFGLINGPATLQAYLNETLSEYLDRFCSAFLDDTIVYSETLEEHIIHVRQVLQRLSDAGLHLNPKKCELHQTETRYLGLIVGRRGVRMQPEKVQAIRE